MTVGTYSKRPCCLQFTKTKWFSFDLLIDSHNHDAEDVADSQLNSIEGEEECDDLEGQLGLHLEVEDIQDDIDSDTVPELEDKYKDVIAKVRKVGKIFSRSPTKNDAVLQKHVL